MDEGDRKNMVLEKQTRFKLLADLFEKENIPAFIKELNGDIHFCNILVNGENSVLVEDFGPEQRAGKKIQIFWLNIQDFDKYEEKKEN